jgi:hypothetical protein
MTKRPGDRTPEPEGGRAAERLRMFEDARRPPQAVRPAKARPQPRKGGRSRAKQDRGKT